MSDAKPYWSRAERPVLMVAELTALLLSTMMAAAEVTAKLLSDVVSAYAAELTALLLSDVVSVLVQWRSKQMFQMARSLGR